MQIALWDDIFPHMDTQTSESPLNGVHIWDPSHIRRYQMFITLTIGANFATVNFITEHGIPNRNLGLLPAYP